MRWAGNVGTGFTAKVLSTIYEQLEALTVKKSPFNKHEEIPAVTWVKPTLVCAVKYSGWGSDNHLRAPSFWGFAPTLKRVTVCAISGPSSPQQVDDAKLLPSTKAEVVIELGGHQLKFTNLNKVFYPADGFTKRDVINYYHDVAQLLVPHLKGRPLSTEAISERHRR